MMSSRQLATLAMFVCTSATFAQNYRVTSVNPESILGSTETSLTVTLPEIVRVPRPLRGPGNSRGKWMLPEVQLAAQPYVATFFVKSGKVKGIEYLNTAPAQQCRQMIPFENTLAELKQLYGDSRVVGRFENGGRLMQSAAFANSTVAVSLHVSSSPDVCSTRVIYKLPEEKDASEL